MEQRRPLQFLLKTAHKGPVRSPEHFILCAHCVEPNVALRRAMDDLDFYAGGFAADDHGVPLLVSFAASVHGLRFP